jgi:hypothetical protein
VVGGPNVFLESTAYNTGEVGPHHRWATGTLFDNIVVKGAGSLSAYNRSNAGSGQGWSGANQVFWNSEAPAMRCESPPTAQNWNVGSITSDASRQCLWESLGKRSPIVSLYKAQLTARLGEQAVRNLDAPIAPSAATPRVCFHEGAQFTGTQVCYGVGEHAWVGVEKNDRFSSARVYGGAAVRVYQHIHFAGSSFSFAGDVAHLGSSGFDNAVSSLKVTP